MKKILVPLLCLMFAFIPLGCNAPQGAETPGADYSAFPNYVEVDKAVYEFGFEQMTTPYFIGNVIYNETVMLVEKDGVISGKLQYKPLKILSVRDFKWENEFGADEYKVEGNVITLNEGSTMPYLTEKNLSGVNIPEPYRQVTQITDTETDWVQMGATIYTEGSLIYGHQVAVSYVYDPMELKTEEFAQYATSGLTKTKAKLSAGEDVKIVAIGDSVAEGCSSSGKFNRPPYMENWVDQSTEALDLAYEGNVTSKNVALGGMTADWGCQLAQTNKIVAENPDLVIIHFGINDSGSGYTAGGYGDNIEMIIANVSARLPDCEFMLIKAFTPNPLCYNSKLFSQYWAKLDEIAETYPNAYTLDMYSQSITMLKTKKYMDVTGNGINHVNDYSSRLYTMNILSALVKY